MRRKSTIGAFVCHDPNVRAQNVGPLRGIAVGIKDIMDTADFPTEMGSPIYRGHRSRGDASVVMLLKQAGASIVGKTTTTAFASTDPTATLNPHNHGHTPGGSSSGSAAAVAAGMIPLALGTQTGGSVIRPASFCGVAAIKPSYRLLPTVGVKCYSWTLDTVGLFAAGVERRRARAVRHDRPARIAAVRIGADAAHRRRDAGFCRRAGSLGRGGAADRRPRQPNAPAPRCVRLNCPRSLPRRGAPIR